MSDDATLDEFAENTNKDTPDQTSRQQHLPEVDELPSDWRLVTVDDIAESIVGGGTPSKSNKEYWNGEIPWASVKDLNGVRLAETEDTITESGIKNSATNLVPSDSIIISTRMTVGEPFLNEIDMAINQDMKAILPDTKQANSLFAVYSLWNKDTYLKSLGRGTTVDGITTRDLSSTHLGLPSISEQRKMATVLHTVDRAIEKTRKIIERAEMLKRGIKQDILTTGLSESETRDVRVVSQEVEIASQWDVVPLPEIARSGEITFIDGDWVESSDMVDDGEYQLIQLGNIGEGYFKGECNRYVNQEFFEDENCTLVEEGDLLISRMAEPILRSLIVPQFDKKSITAVDIVIAKIDESKWDKRYIKYLLNSKSWENIAEALASGSTRKRISRENMSRILIPKPSLESQKNIADVVGSFEHLATTERKQINQFQRFKKGLMQDLLSGEVRTTEADIDIPEEIAKYG